LKYFFIYLLFIYY